MKRIAVLGGGISGLTSAWSLSKSSSKLEVVLLESGSSTGGWIRSLQTPCGSIHEVGPRSMRFRYKAGKVALAMMSELGLESMVIPIGPNHKAANRRLIYTNQYNLVDLPSSLSGLLRPSPPFTSRLLTSILKEPFVKSKQREESDETVHEFIVRRLGNEVADWLIDPLCRGIYAGSSRHLSLQSCFSILANYERKHGSIVMGGIFSRPEPSGVEDNPLVQKAKAEKWQIYTLQGGLATLTNTLKVAVERGGVDIRLNTPVSRVDFLEGGVKISTAPGKQETFDHVISTLPAQALASVLPENCSQMAENLNGITAVPVGVVNLQYKGDVIPEKYRQSFGYLVPSHQQSKVLGVVFDSSTFPELNRRDAEPSTRLTVMIGGHWFEELFGDPDNVSKDTLAQAALQSLHDQTGMAAIDPEECIVSVLKDCIPQYTIGHEERVERIHKEIKSKGLPLSLLGSSYRGVSVNDCILNSLSEVQTVLSSF